jgi:hypothetical protein
MHGRSEMNLLERMYFDVGRGMFREFEGLTTHFQPKDRSLYRKLLPEPFGVPRRPIVTVFVADYLRVVRWPWTRYRYQEWCVLLKSEWKGAEAWYTVTIPVSRWIAKVSGRYLGFPKYVADEITLTRSGETRVAMAKYKGVVQLELEFCPGTARQLAPWEKELADNKSFFKGDAHVLVPPGQGRRAQRIILRHVTQPKWSPVHGMIRVRVDPSESWSGLVPDEGEFPGTYNRFTGGMNLIAERLA